MKTTIMTIALLFGFLALAMTANAQEFESRPAHLNKGEGLGVMALTVTGNARNTHYDFVHVETGRVFSTRLSNELSAQPGDYLVRIPKVMSVQAPAPKVELVAPLPPMQKPAVQQILIQQNPFPSRLGYGLIFIVVVLLSACAALVFRVNKLQQKIFELESVNFSSTSSLKPSDTNLQSLAYSIEESRTTRSPELKVREEAIDLIPIDDIHPDIVELLSNVMERCLGNPEVDQPEANVVKHNTRIIFDIIGERRANAFCRLVRKEWEKQDLSERLGLISEVMNTPASVENTQGRLTRQVIFSLHEKPCSNLRTFPVAASA